LTAPVRALPRADRGAIASAGLAVRVSCAGCGRVVPDAVAFPTRCPAATPGDDIDHVLARRLRLDGLRLVASDDPNPFIRYRELFRAWHVARAAGWDDERYVGLVRRIDDAVAAVDGHGFRVTPVRRAEALGAELGLGGEAGLWVKDETRNVAGSHKARHLMGILLEVLVGGHLDPSLAERPLAIASCGNAALAAAVVARAAGRRLDVFVPPEADPVILDRLARLGAIVERVPRRVGESGDPTVTRLRAAVAAGAIPFTCQGPENGLAIEGGQTLGYELAEAVGGASIELDRVVVQVGGGALASAVAQGLAEATALGAIAARPRLDTVQTAGGWPLRRAYERLAEALRRRGVDPCRPLDLAAAPVRAVLDDAARHRSRYMWPWDPAPQSIAHGILDDETYDWLAVVRAMLATGGRPIVVDEPTLMRAAALADSRLAIRADDTGAAGLAGVLELRRRGELRPTDRLAVFMTGGRRRDEFGASPPQPSQRRQR
jgi:threonine dehydratase